MSDEHIDAKRVNCSSPWTLNKHKQDCVFIWSGRGNPPPFVVLLHPFKDISRRCALETNADWVSQLLKLHDSKCFHLILGQECSFIVRINVTCTDGSITVVIVALTVILTIIISVPNVFSKVFNTLELQSYQFPPSESDIGVAHLIANPMSGIFWNVFNFLYLQNKY